MLSLGNAGGPKLDLDAPSITIRTRSAIVDRLPSDTGINLRAVTSNRGSEGISVLTSGSGMCLLAADRLQHGTSPRNSHVRFVTAMGDLDRRVTALPVANTMFRNGHMSTIFEDTWEAVSDSNKEIRFRRSSRASLNSFDVAITKPSKSSCFVGIPMRPLTRPREVVSIIGNIIRELKCDETGNTVPASTDLEAAVPRFLQSPLLSETAKKSFSVFALITCKDFYAQAGSGPKLKNIVSPFGKRVLLDSLFNGRARLHRVTGGGGGWGNKKGLLSLEPGIDIFADERDKVSTLPPEGEDYDFQKSSALVSPGDNVQFFATFPGQQEDRVNLFRLEDETARTEAWRRYSPSRPQVVIGTSPPNEEYSAAVNNTSSTTDKLIFANNFFGMLSEAGACLGTMPANDVHGPASFTSRLDIPFTTLLAQASRGYTPV
jgi:hypothetical protein